MHLVLVAIFVLAALGESAWAAPKPKPVRVTNFPTSFEVSNLPTVQDVNVLNECGAEPSFQLIGFTTASLAATGVLALTSACQAEFAGTRVCSSEEILKTRSVPAALSGVAWVVPVIRSDGYDVSGAGFVSGSRTDTSCDGWSLPGSVALTVSATGAFALRLCTDPAAVACCGAQ
jgi:hypothetical protein